MKDEKKRQETSATARRNAITFRSAAVIILLVALLILSVAVAFGTPFRFLGVSNIAWGVAGIIVNMGFLAPICCQLDRTMPPLFLRKDTDEEK